MDAKLRIGLTDAGKMILRGIGFVALAALIVPAFGVLSALVSAFLMALVVGFILRPRVRVSGYLPDRIVVNNSVQLRYMLKNIGRFSVYNLCLRFDALPDAIEQVESGHVVSHLGPGDTVEVIVTIRPKRRGYYWIKNPVCQSSFPFGLFSFGSSRDDKEILIVLPTFSFLRILLQGLNPQVHSYSSILAGRTGAFPEYAGNRPFLPGDSRRRIDARAWARLAMPATKEYHENFDNCTALVLDTGVPKSLLPLKTDAIKKFEAAVSLCASVAYTVNDYCLIDLLLAGPDLYQFTNRPRKMRLDKIHEILAGIKPSEDYIPEQMISILTDRLHRISEVIFVLYGWKKAYRQLLELAGQARCHSTVFVIEESGKIDLDQHEMAWREDIRILSPDEILTEQVMHL
ncbi:MAG: DUF58 domain-containing protein [Sedimentisphaerales bacterium]|nr:DUF58 domain-containing protein [Sedimentisphaerales bacterium]